MPLYRANVIVLRRRAFQETDKLLPLDSREHGKLSAIARGARRAQSRLVGATEPLVYARMQLATGRNLDIITEATPRHTFPGLRTSARKVQVALYMAELLDALVEERQSSPEQFDLMLSSLYLLEGKPLDALVVRRFEMQMLDIAGYTPELRHCVVCRAGRPDGRPAAYSAEMGGIVCARCRPGQPRLQPASGAALDAMEALLRLPAHQLEQFALDEGLNLEIGRLTAAHIRCHIQRELKSATLLLDQ